MAGVEVAAPLNTYIMESFLGVFMFFLVMHQEFGLRGCRGLQPIANVEPEVLHSLLYDLTILELGLCVVLLADIKELTGKA